MKIITYCYRLCGPLLADDLLLHMHNMPAPQSPVSYLTISHSHNLIISIDQEIMRLRD